jgi:hypothetical protein
MTVDRDDDVRRMPTIDDLGGGKEILCRRCRAPTILTDVDRTPRLPRAFFQHRAHGLVVLDFARDDVRIADDDDGRRGHDRGMTRQARATARKVPFANALFDFSAIQRRCVESVTLDVRQRRRIGRREQPQAKLEKQEGRDRSGQKRPRPTDDRHIE